jgi:hypothetical protein
MDPGKEEEMTKLVVSGSVVWCLVACASDATLGYGNQAQPASSEGLGGSSSTAQPPPVDASLLAAGTVPRGCEERQEPFNPTIGYRGYIQNFSPGADSGYWPSEVMVLKFSELTTAAVSGRLLSDQAGAGNYGRPATPPCYRESCIQGAEGFEYTMTEGSFDGQRLRFTVNLYEPMCAWCGQQTSTKLTTGTLYQCVPNSQIAQFRFPDDCAILPLGTSEWQKWDCAALYACSVAGGDLLCSCSAEGCTGGSPFASPVTFDLVASGDQLVGPAGSLGTVILTRETP